MDKQSSFFSPKKVFLLAGMIVLFFSASLHAQLVINEVSQGPSGSKEYVELVVTGTPGCAGIPCVDLRGWYIDDNNGNHATGAGQMLLDGESDAITRECIEMALAGDVTAMRLCMERIVPARRDEPVVNRHCLYLSRA